MESTLFKNNFEKRIEVGLQKESAKLMKLITNYIDGHSEVLFDIGPIQRLYFSEEKDRDPLFDMVNIERKELKAVIDVCPALNKEWKIVANEFNIIMALMIREFAKKRKKRELEYCISYLTCSLYSSSQFKYFRYEPNRNIMEYTINNLSNKYLIKQLGSLYKALHATALKSHETYTKDLVRGNDKDIIQYIANLRTRLDNLIQNIAKQFYDNHEKGNYLNQEADNYDEENFYLTDNISFTINRMADKTLLQILTRGVNQDLAKRAASLNNVSVNAVRTALNDLIMKKDEELKELLVLILQLYLMDGTHKPESVGSVRFLTFCLELYAKNNTTDKSILRIKELLDEWLNECSVQYKKTERVATLSAYRKSIFTYFVFLINATAN
jgi:hypothetical protein